MNNYSFVIPCFNCANFIKKKIWKLEKKLKKNKAKYELILVDDGSLDNTLQILTQISLKKKNIKVVKNKNNIGKSYSTIKGIKKSKYKNVILIDCDLPYFKSLEKIIKSLNEDNDLVIINRRMKGSNLEQKKINIYQILRFIIGSIIAFLNLKILNLKVTGGDSQAGLKGFKKIKNFNNLDFVSKKFFFDLELILIYSKKKLKIKSIRTDYTIPSASTIKILNFSKNFVILTEYFKIIKKYKER